MKPAGDYCVVANAAVVTAFKMTASNVEFAMTRTAVALLTPRLRQVK